VRRLIVVAAFLTACSPPPPDELKATGGEQVFAKLCAKCHPPDGRSRVTLAPPLAVHGVVLLQAGGRRHFIRVILNGMSGPIEVGGRKYNDIMSPLRYLKDQQVADVLNYVVKSWGNDAMLPRDFEPFTPEEVRRYREPEASPRQIAKERPAL
jgi:mono/diheme cytochrome c family protein